MCSSTVVRCQDKLAKSNAHSCWAPLILSKWRSSPPDEVMKSPRGGCGFGQTVDVRHISGCSRLRCPCVYSVVLLGASCESSVRGQHLILCQPPSNDWPFGFKVKQFRMNRQRACVRTLPGFSPVVWLVCDILDYVTEEMFTRQKGVFDKTLSSVDVNKSVHDLLKNKCTETLGCLLTHKKV